jgi:hypothetical protein
MVQRNRLFVPIFLASLAVCLFAVPLWSRLPEDPAMVDVRDLAERAPLVFRGRVLTVVPDKMDEKSNMLTTDGKRVNTNFVARFQIDRLYRGKLPGEVLLHFGYGGVVAMGHDCIDFQPNQYWLVFATEKSGALKLFDDCSGALGISSRLGPRISRSSWMAQMEADFMAGLEDTDPASRILSIQRLGGLKLPSSRPALHNVIDQRDGDEVKWAIFATLRTGDVSVLPMVSRLLALGDNNMPEWAISWELRNVTGPSAVPDLLEIFSKTPSDGTRMEVLIALVDNIKDRRVVPILGPSLSSADNQIRYLALHGRNTIANSEACSSSRHWKEDEDAAFRRQVASCKSWWEREGKYQSWTGNQQSRADQSVSDK